MADITTIIPKEKEGMIDSVTHSSAETLEYGETVQDPVDNTKSSTSSSPASLLDDNTADDVEYIDLVQRLSKLRTTTEKPLMSTTTDVNLQTFRQFTEPIDLSKLKLTPIQQGQIQEQTSGSPENPILTEVQKLLEAIENIPTPKKGGWYIETTTEIEKENKLRQRTPGANLVKQKSPALAREVRSTDNAEAQLAPSVTVSPTSMPPLPSFTQFLLKNDLQVLSNQPQEQKVMFLIDEEELKRLVTERAKMLVAGKDARKVDRGTQTYVTQVGKLHSSGCINCGSKLHHFTKCNLPLRPGFCNQCGAQGFDAEDCPYPHGVEHERALDRCAGCSRDLSLYCPECPDCNIRWAGCVDFFRLNYAIMPAWMIPEDHQIMVGEAESAIKRRFKIKFDNPTDAANKIRHFLIRENALLSAPRIANPEIPTASQLSRDKRERALAALEAPVTHKHLDEIARDFPELRDDQGYTVLVTKPLKKSTK